MTTTMRGALPWNEKEGYLGQVTIIPLTIDVVFKWTAAARRRSVRRRRWPTNMLLGVRLPSRAPRTYNTFCLRAVSARLDGTAASRHVATWLASGVQLQQASRLCLVPSPRGYSCIRAPRGS